MITLLVMPPPKPAGLLRCGSAPAKQVKKQRRTEEAARDGEQGLGLAPRDHLSWEQTCQSVSASYYEGPLND
jgi:hypothetical protein